MGDWNVTDIITVAVTVLTTIGGLLALSRKWPFLIKIDPFLEQNAEAIINKLIKPVIEAPIGTVVKHHLEVELEKTSALLLRSEIARQALVALYSFELTIERLSFTQKTALIKFVAESVPNAAQEEIEEVLAEIQKGAKSFSELEIVKAANLFTAAQKNVITSHNLNVKEN